MPIEIERKFLVDGDAWRRDAGPGRRFCQGHVTKERGNTVRVPRADDHAFITVKGARSGIARAEFEYEIPIEDAEEMLRTLCAKPLIEKTRYTVPHGGMVWEIDVFGGDAEGVIVAEIELERSDQEFSLPDWIGAEVTHDPRFRNSQIVLEPGVAMESALQLPE
jgi:CYTH domain-containing protein